MWTKKELDGQDLANIDEFNYLEPRSPLTVRYKRK